MTKVRCIVDYYDTTLEKYILKDEIFDVDKKRLEKLDRYGVVEVVEEKMKNKGNKKADYE
ncbi:MAG: hypothetical protein ACK5LC_01230 [Coprobacillaceae bacterium]